ncbi:hypothetical protein PRIPAC_73972, partial [Pristionchus pacificus]
KLLMYTPSTSSPDKCKVCSGRACGTHFSIPSCRACAAFFRRSLSTKRKFECFKACPDSPECKKCRLDRCFSAGMVPTVNLRIKNSDRERSPPTPTVLSTHPEITLLHRLVANYKDFARERLAFEQDLLGSSNEMSLSPFQLFPSDESQSFQIYIAKFDFTNLVWRGTAERSTTFLTNSFDEVYSLQDENKFTLVQNLIFLLYSSEGYFRSVKTFKERPMETFFVSLTSTLRYDGYPSFFEGSAMINPTKPVVNKLIELNALSRESLVPILDRMNLSEIEFIASLVVALWSTCSHTNQELARIGDSYRKRVFQELHVLYRDEFKLENYATRLGELMTFTNTLQICAAATLAEIQFFNFFEVFDKNSFASSISRKPAIKEEILF